MTVYFKEVTRCSKKIVRVFQGNLKGVSRVFQGSFKEVSLVFQGIFMGFQVNRNVTVFPECFKCVSRKIQETIQAVSKKFHVAWHS